MSERLQALRLVPGDDLRGSLDAALAASGHRAGFVVAGIGSLREAALRLAGAEAPTRLVGDLEIVGLAGSLSPDGSHLHMSIADAQGRVVGGHVSPGCTVRTTAELLLAWLPHQAFSREADPLTGYLELVIRPAGRAPAPAPRRPRAASR